MEDRELLELAAKAAGMDVLPEKPWPRGDDGWFFNQVGDQPPALYSRKNLARWSPLADDGDALRLAVTLSLHIEWRFDGRVAVSPRDEVTDIYCMESTREDKQSATRRAIVHAAAAIGKEM
ncbi:hypothetical protein [Achromobacter ruhlandii]|uniref:hypothetical protein n=1 Tax=Achromobacter ruhlandii TaxID=72557 RepID=UPI003BA25BB4